ncbi:MAG: hypothetical protein O2782_03565 [bacterium]|nr:hypothetical protein [bacterium]
MRTCFHLTILLSILFACAAPLQAQWSTARVDSARQDSRRRLLQALDLTQSQQDTLRAMRDRLQSDVTALRKMVEDGDVLAEEGRLRYSEALRAYRTRRDSVLTVTQLDLMERARTTLREQILFDGQGMPEVSNRLLDALGLDDLQRRRWLSLLARLREQVRELRETGETLVTDDYRRLREEYRLSFEAILTPEQRLELERVRVARAQEHLQEDETEFDLLEDVAAPVEDAWRSLDAELGDDGAEP